MTAMRPSYAVAYGYVARSPDRNRIKCGLCLELAAHCVFLDRRYLMLAGVWQLPPSFVGLGNANRK